MIHRLAPPLLAALALVGCGGGGSSPSRYVTLTPREATVAPGGEVELTLVAVGFTPVLVEMVPTVEGGGGVIPHPSADTPNSTSGVYHAPDSPGDYCVRCSFYDGPLGEGTNTYTKFATIHVRAGG